MTAKTWKKDSYGLYDYQAKAQQISEQVAFIDETTYILRNNYSQSNYLKYVRMLDSIR